MIGMIELTMNAYCNAYVEYDNSTPSSAALIISATLTFMNTVNG